MHSGNCAGGHATTRSESAVCEVGLGRSIESGAFRDGDVNGTKGLRGPDYALKSKLAKRHEGILTEHVRLGNAAEDVARMASLVGEDAVRSLNMHGWGKPCRHAHELISHAGHGRLAAYLEAVQEKGERAKSTFLKRAGIVACWDVCGRAASCGDASETGFPEKGKLTEKEARSLIKQISLANEASDLAAMLELYGEKAVREMDRLGWAAPHRADELVAGAAPGGLVAHLGPFVEEGELARNELFQHAYPLARWIVDDCVKMPLTPEEREDAIGIAGELLLEIIASGKYDPRRSSFSHYYRIGALPKLMKLLNQEIRPIKYDNDSLRISLRLGKARDEFYEKNMSEADYRVQAKTMLPKIVGEMGLKVRKAGYDERDAAFYNGIQPAARLDGPVGDGLRSLGDLIAAPAPIADERGFVDARGKLLDMLEGAMEQLSAREQDIVRSRFLLSGECRPTQEELAAEYGVSKQRIKQLEDKALRTLGRLLDPDSVFAEKARMEKCSAPES